MARRGMTEKPCEGCGQPGPRAIGKVCYDCRKLIEEATAARAREAAQTERVVYRCPWAVHAYPIYSCGAELYWKVDAELRVIPPIIAALVDAVGEPVSGQMRHVWPSDDPFLLSDRRYRGDWGSGDRRLLIKPAVRDAIDKLDQAINAALKAAYRQGKAEGATLLRSLAAGEITVAALNERTIGGKG